MSDDASNGGKATIREVRDLVQELSEKIDDRFDALENKYVLRRECAERHRYIDPRQIWAAAALLAILGPALTAIIISGL